MNCLCLEFTHWFVNQAWLHVFPVRCSLVMDHNNSALSLESTFRFVFLFFMHKLWTESLWHVVYTFLPKSLFAQNTGTHSPISQCVQTHALTPTLFKCSPSRTGLASAFQLTLFLLQMTASAWEMSSSLCQHCLASSNICEVLSSSLQLRRAVS